MYNEFSKDDIESIKENTIYNIQYRKYDIEYIV
jgi:hypothetical protein